MNALAGWGFATPAALTRHFGLPVEHVARSVRSRGGRHVSRADLAAYAASQTKAPSVLDVRMHFHCSRAASYRHHRAVISLMTERERA